MESYCSLCTFKVPQGANNFNTLYFRYYTQTFLCYCTRLIINQINKVQWVDFKLENVLVSLHSLKTMGLGPFGASAQSFLRNGELLGHSPIHIVLCLRSSSAARQFSHSIQQQTHNRICDVICRIVIQMPLLPITQWSGKYINMDPLKLFFMVGWFGWFLVFNATFNNISVISWRSWWRKPELVKKTTPTCRKLFLWVNKEVCRLSHTGSLYIFGGT
jgi:hypothetical protein